MVSSGKLNFGDLNLLTIAEQEQLLIDFNAKSISPLPDQTVIARFAEQVMLQNDRPAIITGAESISYRELDEQSSRLAHCLIEKGVKHGDFVPVCQERSASIVISMLAIVKAGGVYVPIDPGYPAERIQYMLTDTGAGLLITDQKALAGLPAVIADLELINPENLGLDWILSACSPGYFCWFRRSGLCDLYFRIYR
ncbi:AMP-binding protein [Pedobacter sp. NJ-S-72]